MQLNKNLDKHEIELKYPEKLTSLNKSNGQLAINLSQKRMNCYYL